jgi:hypothetical protein
MNAMKRVSILTLGLALAIPAIPGVSHLMANPRGASGEGKNWGTHSMQAGRYVDLRRGRTYVRYSTMASRPTRIIYSPAFQAR